ncbi:hypothetical protein TNCV_5141631 [Trichonephila clavipes]|nr:hypothetical protein TNCV_5141631 [Trichonephila clavipes]
MKGIRLPNFKTVRLIADPPSNTYRSGHLSAPSPKGEFYAFLNSFRIGTLSIYSGSLLISDEVADNLAKAAASDPEDPDN